jgi:hypothetical protein
VCGACRRIRRWKDGKGDEGEKKRGGREGEMHVDVYGLKLETTSNSIRNRNRTETKHETRNTKKEKEKKRNQERMDQPATKACTHTHKSDEL